MSTEDNKNSKATIKLLVETETADSPTVHSPSDSNASAVVKSTDRRASSNAVNKVNILDKLVAANMLVPGSRLGPEFQDQYRRIKRPLLSNAYGKTASLVERGNLILVTSSVPGEGKTFSAVNLALSVAHEKDNTVLLVDGDVAKQGVSRMLGIDKAAGLVDVLENGHLTINDVLLQTDVPNLRILAAGRQDEYVTELLASQRMTDLVNELVDRYDDRVIIMDGPPLLPTPQTQILAGLVGQVVFVVETAKTSQSLVVDALELIPDGKAAGIVMNKNEGLTGHGGYYYGHYGNDTLKDGNRR